MCKRQKLISAAREDVNPNFQLPAELMLRIAAQCGRDEIADAQPIRSDA